MKNESFCVVVTVLPCDHPSPHLESPKGCQNCEMLNWLCFETEQKANEAYIAQFPHHFKEGVHIPQ